MSLQLDPCTQIAWDRWCLNAQKHGEKDAIVHWVCGEEPYRWTYSGIVSAAENFSLWLLESGIRKGDVCAFIIRHNKFLYPLYLAVSKLGAIPAILAYPNPRLHRDKFREGILGMSQRSGLDWILTERDLQSTIEPLTSAEGSSIKGLLYPLEKLTSVDVTVECNRTIIDSHDSIKASDPLLLQHSSGTTGLQKPVLLSHRSVLEHVEHYAEAIGLNEKDKIVSWLPLYHDMGLIAAFHLPLAFGIPTVQLDPFEWVKIPSLLLEVISKEKGTISWLPNFAYNLLVDKVSDDTLKEVSLESWRLIVNCSEPIRYDSHQKFLERFRSYGLNPSALSTCYAMAETTFAVTQTPPGLHPSCLWVDKIELSRGAAKITSSKRNSRICISSGRPIKGCQVRIVDPNRNEVADGTLGELAIQSASLFDGYRNYPEKTTDVLVDGWYYSGDLGFRKDEEYYIVGRKKDVIIVAGNNVYPEDIEDALSTVDNVIRGRVVAIAEEDSCLGTEQISVIVETSVDTEDGRRDITAEIIKAGMTIDITIRRVYLVPPRWLIKSSAGKPSRGANKARILMQKNLHGTEDNCDFK